MLLFFNQAAVSKAVSDLAAAKRLTVIAGAGSSMEIGLPSWESLVLGLLDDALDARAWGDDREGFRAAARQSGLLTTAEIVGSLLGEDMSGAIRTRLYGDNDPAALQPGPLARAIAGLQHDFGPTMRLGTTNYDDLLERALHERPAAERWWKRVRSSVTPGPPARGVVAVTHLHGLLGTETRGKIVLSERDYQRMQLTRTWQERWATDALSDSTCLFVGASMTDANLIRYLYGAEPSRLRHVALFKRRPADTVGEERFRTRLEQAETARWLRLGITPLYADHFAEIAQFIHEVAAQRRLGTAYLPLPQRLHEWFDREGEAGSLYVADDAGYGDVQQLLRSELCLLRDDARKLLSARGVDVPAEKLGVAVLSLFPPGMPGEAERVIVLASSDRIMTSVDSIAPIPLGDGSEWTGVKAICRGSPLDEEKDVYASRWRHVLGYPIYSDGVRTPRGAITIASMSPSSRLALNRLPPDARQSLANLVSRRSHRLFADAEVRV